MEKENTADANTQDTTTETGNSSRISSIKYCSMCRGLAAFNTSMLAMGQLPKCYGNEVIITPTEDLKKKLNDIITGKSTTDCYIFEEHDTKSVLTEQEKLVTNINDTAQDITKTSAPDEPTMNQSNFIMGKVVIVQYDQSIAMIPTMGVCYSTQSILNKSEKLNTTTSSTTMMSSSESIKTTTTTTATATTTATTTINGNNDSDVVPKPKKSILEQIDNLSEWRYVIMKTDNTDTNRKYMFTDEGIDIKDGESIVSETYILDMPRTIAGYYSDEAALAYHFWSKTLDNFPSRWLNFTMKYSEVTYHYTNKFSNYFIEFYKKQWSSFNYDVAMEKLNYVNDTYATESNKLFSKRFGEFEADVKDNISTPPPTTTTAAAAATTNKSEKKDDDENK